MKHDPLIGTLLGAYRIQSLLGEGGMARVYKAFHERLQREVAIKIIRPESASEADFQRRFEQEAQLIASLQHRNIVAVYDFGESPDMAYLVMQYVAGGTLRDQLLAGQCLEPRRAALYTLQMARALHHAHQYGIVHRDVKPLNMLVSSTNRNELLLSDFGLAKLFSNSFETLLTANPAHNKDAHQSLSEVGGLIGTPRYMAPEQCLGKPVDARTDIYALGVVLFEMLTGRPLYQGETSFSLLYQHAYSPAPSVHAVNPLVSDALVQITARALAKKPEERYQSAKEMGLALEQFLTPPVPVVQHTTAPSSHRRKHMQMYFTTVMTLTLAVLFSLLYSTGFIHWPALLSSVQKTTLPGGISQTIPCTSAQNTLQTQSFTEIFQDNQRNWLIGNTDGVTSKIENNSYTLSLPNTSKLYLFCPSATDIGALPGNFTLTTQITQKSGGEDAYYGIAFHLRHEADTATMYGYAFAINSQGTWVIFKYDPHVKDGNTTLASGHNFSGIHKPPVSNSLQVVVVGHKMIFKINDTVLSVNGDGQTEQTLNDSSYTGGLFGILASGPNTTFSVTSVKLMVP
ncbi:MAG: hypothetical protein PVS3B3_27160 [Ktedonobacteraceae bacterium]